MIEASKGKRAERVRIIDFDWAGKKGEVRYPLHLSTATKGADGAEDLSGMSTTKRWCSCCSCY